MSLNFLDCLNRALHRINPEACIILAVAVFIFFLQLIVAVLLDAHEGNKDHE